MRGDSEAGDRFGAVLAQGDFNRDGHADLAVSAPLEDVPEGANDRDGSVHIFYGANALSVAGDRVLTQATRGLTGGGAPETLDQFGSTLASGDFDGDRYWDLAIGVSDESTGAGSRVGGVHVLYGHPAGLTTKRDQFFTQDTAGMAGDGAESQDLFGRTLEVGDFDADGRDDLAIAATLEDVATGVNDNDGAVHVIDGGPNGLIDPRRSVPEPGHPRRPRRRGAGGRHLRRVSRRGRSGRGRKDDLVVGLPFEGVAVGASNRDGAFSVLYGDRGGVGLQRNQFFTQETAGVPGGESAEAGDRFGFTLETGDFNDDDVADLAVTALFEHVGASGTGEHGAVHVLLGGEGASPGAAGGSYLNQDTPGVEGELETGDHFGERLEAGDFTGDGRADLVVGVPQEGVTAGGNDKDGTVQILRGSATGVVATGDVLFTQGAPVTQRRRASWGPLRRRPALTDARIR